MAVPGLLLQSPPPIVLHLCPPFGRTTGGTERSESDTGMDDHPLREKEK